MTHPQPDRAADGPRGDPDFPVHHVRPPSGWVNDPNGPIRWNGRYHLFFQHNPKAPVHLLVIPKRHVESVMTLTPEDAPLVGRLVLTARRLGEAHGLSERGYRLSIHCGPEGGQVVYHLHLHFLGGRRDERKVERR